MSEPSAFEIDMAIEEIRRHKSSTDKIPAELTKAGVRTIQSKSNFKKQKLLKEWKESIIVAIYKKGDKTNCSNNRGMSRIRTTYKILLNILLSRFTPYAEEITGNHQCGFRSNSSTTDHIFHIRPILEKKWKHNEAVDQLFTDFKKAYDSVRREVLCNITIELGISMKIVLQLIKMLLNPYPANVENMVSSNNDRKWQMGFNSAFKGLKESIAEPG